MSETAAAAKWDGWAPDPTAVADFRRNVVAALPAPVQVARDLALEAGHAEDLTYVRYAHNAALRVWLRIDRAPAGDFDARVAGALYVAGFELLRPYRAYGTAPPPHARIDFEALDVPPVDESALEPARFRTQAGLDFLLAAHPAVRRMDPGQHNAMRIAFDASGRCTGELGPRRVTLRGVRSSTARERLATAGFEATRERGSAAAVFVLTI